MSFSCFLAVDVPVVLDVLHAAHGKMVGLRLDLPHVVEVLNHPIVEVPGLVAVPIQVDHLLDFVFHLGQEPVSGYQMLVDVLDSGIRVFGDYKWRVC
jgi:hypothetical protein